MRILPFAYLVWRADCNGGGVKREEWQRVQQKNPLDGVAATSSPTGSTFGSRMPGAEQIEERFDNRVLWDGAEGLANVGGL